MKELCEFDSLVLMYPHLVLTSELESWYYRYAKPKSSQQRINGWIAAMTNRVKALRRRTTRVYLVAHRFSDGSLSELSPRFLPQESDIIIDSGVVVDVRGRWMTPRPSSSRLAAEVLGERIVVAGFHSADCVSRMVMSLIRSGRTTLIAPLATELHYLNTRCAYYGNTTLRLPLIVTLPELKAAQRRLMAKAFASDDRLMEEFVR